MDEIEDSDLDQDELIDIDAEAAELEKLDEVTAERDDYRDKFMRALADAENARKRADWALGASLTLKMEKVLSKRLSKKT